MGTIRRVSLLDAAWRDAGIDGNVMTEERLSKEGKHVHEILATIQDELRKLEQRRAEVTERIGILKQTISGLAKLFGVEMLDAELLELIERKSVGRQSGFTRACRVTLMEAGRPLSVRQVCELIRERIPTVLIRHKYPAASVTTVLNRLVSYGEAQIVLYKDAPRAWRWMTDSDNRSIQKATKEVGRPKAGTE